MEVLINQFLAQFPVLSDTDRKQLAAKLNVKKFKRKTVLQEQDKIPKNCFFVLQGCIRQYHVINGINKTTEFYTETHPVVSSEAYTRMIPSDYYLECVEDSILLVGEQALDEKLVKEFPALQDIMVEITEKEWHKTKEQFNTFKLLSPKERYLHFLENRKDLLNRVPNTQIANYLGITAESLSRIRKRITKTVE